MHHGIKIVRPRRICLTFVAVTDLLDLRHGAARPFYVVGRNQPADHGIGPVTGVAVVDGSTVTPEHAPYQQGAANSQEVVCIHACARRHLCKRSGDQRPILLENIQYQLENDKQINVIGRKFQPGDLTGAFIAIAATANLQTNAAVAAEGLEKSVMVNVVDDPARCDFILPSYCRRGGIILAVSTSGMSPALARKIMSRLEKEFGPEYGTLATITQKVRARLKREKIKINSSRWQQALDIDRLTGLIRSGHTNEAEKLLFNQLRKEQI